MFLPVLFGATPAATAAVRAPAAVLALQRGSALAPVRPPPHRLHTGRSLPPQLGELLGGGLRGIQPKKN